MLIKVKLYRNPWPHTIPDEKLLEILTKLAEVRAKHVRKQFDAGEWVRESLGLALLDPTAGISTPSEEVLLATIAIGEEGERFVPNAIAKAIEHREKGQLAGYGAYVDLTQTRDGDFTYGFSTQVDNTIAGASGQTELQDACEAGYAAVSFNYFVRAERAAWRDVNRENRWFCDKDEPAELYAELAAAETDLEHEADIPARMNS